MYRSHGASSKEMSSTATSCPSTSPSGGHLLVLHILRGHQVAAGWHSTLCSLLSHSSVGKLPAPLINPSASLQSPPASHPIPTRVSCGRPMAQSCLLTHSPFPEPRAVGALYLQPRLLPGIPRWQGTAAGCWHWHRVAVQGLPCPTGALTRAVLSGTLCSLCRRSWLSWELLFAFL